LSAKNWLKFIFLGLAWGTAFLWIKIAVQELPPLTMVAFRTAISTVGLLTAAVLSKQWIRRRDIPILALLGLLNVAIPFPLVSWAEKHISSAMASILNSTVPLFTLLIASMFLKEEKLTWKHIAGLILGFGGVVVLMSGELLTGDRMSGWGIAAMLAAACLYAVSGIVAKSNAKGIAPTAQALGQMGSSFVFILPAALVVDVPFAFPRLAISWVALIWLGLLCSCICTIVWYSLLNTVGPVRTSMTSYMLPLVGVVLGVLFLGETVNWRLIAGGLLIIIAVLIVNTQSPLPVSDRISIQAEDLECSDGE